MTLAFEPEGAMDLPGQNSSAACAGPSANAPALEAWATKRVKMTLNQFSSFAAVARYRSVTRASAELRLSQPSISFQLKQLEEHHGQKLYRRTAKGIEITEAGQALLLKIGPILRQVAELERDFRPPASATPRATLRVGGTFSASALMLPRLLAQFRPRHPHIDLALQTGTSEKLERLTARGAIEIAVTDRKPVAHGLGHEPFRAEKVRAFVRPDHPLAREVSVSLAELLAEPLIVRGGQGISGATQRALKKLQDQGWAVRIGMFCDGPAVIKAAVRQNMGVGIAFADSIKLELEAGEFKVLQVKGFEIRAESFVIYAKNRPLPASARDFLDLLRASGQRKNSVKRARRSTVSPLPSHLEGASLPLAAAAVE